MTRSPLRLLPRPWMHAAVGLVLLAGCRKDGGATDPNDGAIHLPIIGQTEQYGQTTEVEPIESEAGGKLETLGGRYGRDVSALDKAVHEQWANRDRHRELDGVDPDRVMEDLASAAGKADNEDVLAKALREATCRLSDGHLRIQESPSRAKTWNSGMHVMVASGEFVIDDVDPDHWESGLKRPKRGDVIEKVDGVAIGEFVDRTCLQPGSTPAQRERLTAEALGRQHLFATEKPLAQRIAVRRGKKLQTIDVDWDVSTGASEPGPCVEGKMIGKAGLVTIHTFACNDADDDAARRAFQHELDDALAAVSDAKSITLDLRDNAGGSEAQARLAARLLVPGNPVWTRSRDADGGAFADEILEGDGSVATTVPLQVLIGPGCASTCEIFVSVLANRPDTVLIGQATAGSVGNPQPLALPASGITMSIPRTQYALPGTDVLIEGRGVSPQVEISPTADDVRRRRDPALENAFSR